MFKVAVEYLVEMNEDVKGTARVGNFDDILEHGDKLTVTIFVYPVKIIIISLYNKTIEPEYLCEFSIVVVSNLIKNSLLKVAALCARFHIPLVSVRSYGFIGTYQIQIENHEIIEGKKEGANTRIDLRLHAPFRELEVLNLKRNKNNFHLQ